MGNYLSTWFWFNQRPEVFTFRAQIIIASFLGLLLVLAIVTIILGAKKGFYRRLWGKFFSLFLSNFLIGTVLFFFNIEAIPFLASRFWYLLWAVGFITWAVFIILYLKKLPAQKKALDEEKKYKKYIP